MAFRTRVASIEERKKQKGKTYSGVFKPAHPSKYRGDVNNINWRSKWELDMMMWLDSEPSVLEWASEELAIPYISPVDERPHRYFPDFYMKSKDRSGKITKTLIEVKPAHQCAPPKPQKKMTARYLTETRTFAVNQAKWDAAERFCKEVGWNWMIVTENELYGGLKK